MVLIAVNSAIAGGKTTLIEKIEENIREVKGKKIFCIKGSEYPSGKIINYLSYFVKRINDIVKIMEEYGEDNIFIIEKCWFIDQKYIDNHIFNFILEKSNLPKIDAYIFIENKLNTYMDRIFNSGIMGITEIYMKSVIKKHEEMIKEIKENKPLLILDGEVDFLNNNSVQKFIEGLIPKDTIIGTSKENLFYLVYNDKLGELTDDEIKFLENITFKNERLKNYGNMFLLQIYIYKTKNIDYRVINALKTNINLNRYFNGEYFLIDSYTPLNIYLNKSEIDINILKCLITEKNINDQYYKRHSNYIIIEIKPIIGYIINNLDNLDSEILLLLMDNLNYDKVIEIIGECDKTHTFFFKNIFEVFNKDVNCTLNNKKRSYDIWEILENLNIKKDINKYLEDLKEQRKYKVIIEENEKSKKSKSKKIIS